MGINMKKLIILLLLLSLEAAGQKIGSGRVNSGCLSGICNGTVTLQNIELSPSGTTRIAVGTNSSFTATGNYTDGSQNDVTAAATWVSSSPSVASLVGGSTGNNPQLLLGTTAGTTNVTAQVGAIVSAPTALTVVQVTVGPSNLPSVITGAIYNQTLTVTGGTAPYSWSCTVGCTGANPWVITSSSLQLNGSATASTTISGTAGTIGAYNFTVQACDVNSFCDTQAYTININSGGSCVAGPPNYLCSNQTTSNYTGFPTVLTPPFNTTTLVNSTATDVTLNPNYDCYTRLTDPASAGNNSVGNVTHSGGNSQINWSWNETYVGVTFIGGIDYIYKLTTVPSTPNCPNGAVQIVNPVSVLHPSVCKTGTGPCRDTNLGSCGSSCNLTAIGGSWRFATGNPANDNVLYVLKNVSQVWKNTINGLNDMTAQLVFDFTAPGNCPEISGLSMTSSSIMSASYQEGIFTSVFSNTGGQGTGIWGVAYKPGTGCAVINIFTGNYYNYCAGSCAGIAPTGTETVCNNANGTNNNSGAHNASASWDGTLMGIGISAPWVNNTGSNSKCTSPTGGSFGFGWKIGTNVVTITVAGSPDFAVGHGAGGFIWDLEQNYPNPNKRQITTPNTFSQFYKWDNIKRGTDVHGTWIHPLGNDTFPWFFQTAANSLNFVGVNDTFPAYLVNEIYALGWNATYPPGATPVRFGHSFSNSATDPSTYFGCRSAIGTTSTAGHYQMFGSGMFGQLGKDSSGNNRCDAFIILLQ